MDVRSERSDLQLNYSDRNYSDQETPSRRVPEIKSSGKSDGARRTAATSGLQTPPAVGAVSPGAKAEAPAIAREAMGPVAETKPTTIEGWTVLDVRGGTAFSKGRMGSGLRHEATQCPGSGEFIPSCVGATAG